MDADAIFEEGMREVHAIEAQDAGAGKRRRDTTIWPAFMRTFRQIQNCTRHPANSYWACISTTKISPRARITDVVPVAPASPLEVVPMDSFRAPNAVPADYSPGSIEGGRPGRVNVNLYNPSSRLLLNVEAIAYHEGMPGHHLQFSSAGDSQRPA